jgi:hypothetical protein
MPALQAFSFVFLIAEQPFDMFAMEFVEHVDDLISIGVGEVTCNNKNAGVCTPRCVSHMREKNDKEGILWIHHIRHLFAGNILKFRICLSIPFSPPEFQFGTHLVSLINAVQEARERVIQLGNFIFEDPEDH